MSNIKCQTLTLTGKEICVPYKGYGVAVRNDGTNTIYVSGVPGIVKGGDGVVSVPAGSSVTISSASEELYLLGEGTVFLMETNSSSNPFKASAQSGGSGADEIARAAINTHVGNDSIHVSADERSAWNSKADISDIPAALPANGGNADTVGNKGTADLIAGYTLSDNYLAIPGNSDLNSYVSNGLYLASDSTLSKTLKNSPYSTSGFYLAVYVRNKSNILQTATAWDGTEKRRMFNGSSWADWTSINSKGNAASLESHPASDFVLKSDFDALLARVVKLEAQP